LLAPVVDGLARVRDAHAVARSLSMADHIALGVLRRLQGTTTLRDQFPRCCI
jgi:hypothetical protein